MKTFLRTLIVLVGLLAINQFCWGQVTLFTESMGTVSSTTTIAAHEAADGFDNDAFTMTGTADIRNTTVSTGYTGASGSANVFFTNTIGRYFLIEGINTIGYTNLTLSLGHYKSTTAANNELSIEVSSDGTNWTPLTYSRPTGTGTTIWLLITPTGTIPSTANLRIRFTQTSSTPQFRIDDVKLVGTPSVSPTLSVNPTTLSGFTYPVGGGPSTEQTFTLSGSNLTGFPSNISVFAPSDYEVSLSSGSGFASSINVPYSSATLDNTTIYVRLAAGLAIGTYIGDVGLAGGGDADGASVALNGAVTAVSSILLADNGTQIAAADVGQGSLKHALHTFTLTVADAVTTLTQVDFTSAGTYSATDIDRFQLWYSTSNSLSGAAQIGTDITTTLGTGSHSFTSLSQNLAIGTAYFWITTDIDASGTVGNTINAEAVTTGGLTFSSGNKSGSTTAGGAQTIIAYSGPMLLISEVADPGDNFNARFVELYNAGSTTIDFDTDDWYLSIQANGSGWSDVQLTGTIDPGATHIIAYNSTDFNTAYGFAPDQVSGNITGNGDDGYFLYSGAGHTTGTLVDAYGVIDQDGTGQQWEYLDSRAERDCAAVPNSTWTASEWTITSADVADMTPGVHCGAEVDWCNLQFPASGSIRGGNTYNVYARVYEPGITDSPGEGTAIDAWIGYSTINNDPELNPGNWTWVAATYNADDGVNNDEYVANIGSALTGGTYYYASRFNISGGSYSYGGYNTGFWDGTTNVSGVLTVDDYVDWCNLQSPLDGTVAVGSPEYFVYAQIWEDGYTNPAGQALHIQSWIGYSTSDTNPNTWTNWVPASFNVQSGNNDEYRLDLGTAIGTAGTYYYASRFQIGNGSYYYGGFDGGFWDHIYTGGVPSDHRSGRLIITGPTIAVDPITLSGFSYQEGSGPSSQQSFTVQGSNLTNDITVTPPANWEIATVSGGPYQTTPITLTQSGGSVALTTIYTRMVSGLTAAGSPYSGNIACASIGATTVNVAVSGSVTTSINAWINEFHYDNDGTDEGETVEVVINDPGSYTLSNFRVDLYNGADGLSYGNETLNNFVVGATSGTATIYTWAQTGIQNGPDAIALSYNGELIQFLSYEGSFLGTAGVASGVTSTNIGVAEAGDSPLGYSLQLSGAGCSYADFTWQGSAAHTMGLVNNGQTLCVPLNDSDSEVSASAVLSEPLTISSLIDTQGESVSVFDFTLTDVGATGDELPTIIDQLVISQGSGNDVADWTGAIAGAYLSGPDLGTPLAGTVSSTGITFSGIDFISIANGSNEIYTLSVYLLSNLTGAADHDNLVFALDYTDIDTDVAGSSFGSGAPESGSTNVAIDIIATELRFAQQPSDANANNCMSPDVSVEATDANGNRDLDFTESIRITSTGTMLPTPLEVIAVSGLSVFTGASCVNHTDLGTGLTLNAERTSTGDWDVTSNTFNIINQCIPDLIISEYIEGSVNNKYIEIYNGTGQGVDLSDYDLVRYSQGSGSVTDVLDLGTSVLANEAVFVVANSNATAWSGTPDLSTDNNMMTYNGDDVVALRKSTVNIDIIGQIGFDPGSQWGTDPISTANNTIVRKATIFAGDNNGADAFDPALEWDGYDVDYVGDLGSHIANCVCEVPTLNSTLMTFPNTTGTTIDVSWTMGNGAKRIVVVRQGLPVSWTPTNNVTYSANADFTLATDLGSGNKVVYNGAGNSFTLTGLNVGTLYYFEVYEYNCAAGNEKYLTTTPLEGNETTAIQNVANFRLTCITNTTATLEWDEMTGNYDGILIAVRQGGVPSDPSCDGSTLNLPDVNFSTADVYCGNGTGSVYVYNAKGTNVTVTGLTPGLSYTFMAFTYVGSDWTTGTQTTKIANVQDVSAENTTPSNAQMLVYWINPTLCYDEIMVVAHAGGSVVSIPAGDGSAYTANADFGNPASQIGASGDYVVYKGVNTYVDVTALANGTNYCFKIFVREGTEWSPGVEVCDIPADVTMFEPGEFVVIGFDSKVSGGSSDGVYLMNFVDIKSGTKFKWVNSRFEAGAPANVRTMHWGGSGDEPYDDPAYLEIQWTGAAPLPAGSIISFETTGSNLTNTRIDGVATANLILSSFQGMANVSSTGGDQMWLVQGTFTAYGTVGVDRYNLLDGNILFGLTSLEAWVPITSAVSDADDGTGRESRVHPALDCFNVDLSISASDYIYYRNGTGTTPGDPIHYGTKRNVLLGIMTASNWNSGTGTTSLDITEEFIAYDAAPSAPATLGKRFAFTSGPSTGDGTWIGGVIGYEYDWFHCGNWEGLTVPDSSVNVTINDVASSPDINYLSVYSPKYDYTASCLNLIIDNETLTINGSLNDELRVHGNLTLQNSAVLNMDDETGDQDGYLYIKGNWLNNGSFNEGDGTVVFNGTTQQSITTGDASGIETFANLTLNNTYTGGVLMNDHLLVEQAFIQTNNTLDLNGFAIELEGPYTNTNSFFIGDAASDFTINGVGAFGNLYFKTDFNLSDFTMNRTGERAVLMTDLYMGGNLNITAGGVTLSAVNDYTVTGTISNSIGSNGLLLRSNSESTASLLHSTPNVAAMCERYLTANNWHYVFSPLSTAPISQLTTTTWGVDNPNFYWYNEPIADFWLGSTVYNPTGWTAPAHSGTLLTDRGYIHQSPEDNTYTLSGGNLYAGDKSFTLSYTDNGTGTEPTTSLDWNYFEGWNLFGNPYPSALDWNHAGLDKTYVENFIYYYNDILDQYVCYGASVPWDNGITVNGGTQYIPANQGFFVKAIPTGHGQNFTIPNTARVHNGQAFYKGPQDMIPNLLRLQIEKDDYSDEIVVRTLTDATVDHDYQYDAYKMFAWNNTKPQLYSRNEANSNIYAVNTLPDVIGHTVVPLGVQIGVSGEYHIRMTENNFSGMHVWLEDALTGEDINLLDQATYTFPIAAELNAERFFLHLGQNTAPTLNANIPDQEIFTDQAYVYQVPAGLFSDVDVTDVLTITADLGKGKSLPEWLSFDAETGTFSGTPTEVQTLNIVVTATDRFGAQASDSFVLNVKSYVDVDDITGSVSVYPNPAEEMITVTLSGINQAKMTMTDVNGKTVLQQSLNGEKTPIDLSTMAKGIYFIKIISDQGTFNQKLIVR